MFAFELRAQHKAGGAEPFSGGSFALPGGKTFDIGAELEKGKGRIESDDAVVVDRLQQVPALKQVSAKPPTGKSRSRKRAAATNGGEA